MDPVIIYGIIAGAISAILAIYRASSHISKWLQQRTLFYVFKYLIYPTFIRRRRFLGPFTRWRILCTVIHWIATAVCNVVGVRDLPQASSRAGSLATLHLVPLLFGNRLSFTADLLGLSLQTCVVLHKSIGIMAVVQASVHTVLFFLRSTLTLQNSRHFWGLLSGIAFLALWMLLAVRLPMFEMFLKSHYILGIFMAYSIWRHVQGLQILPSIFIVIALAMFGMLNIGRYTRILVQNLAWHVPYAPTQVSQVGDILRVQLQVPRPWKVRAGQYVYIWMPGVGFGAMFQSHPFMISWWDHDVDGNATNIYLLVKPKSGFTHQLLQHVGGSKLKAWIDGPYGKTVEAYGHGTVVMFATGIGIAAQVPHIKEILRNYHNYRARTKRVLLIWQMEKECDQDWVQQWMTELLNEDKENYILQIQLYVLRGFDDEGKSYGDKIKYGSHQSIRKLYGRPQVDSIIQTEIDKRRGSLLITTSSDCTMQDKVHRATSKRLEEDITLVHLAFQPRNYQSLWSSKPPEVNYEGVA